MGSKDNNIIYGDIVPHGCSSCGEVNKGYTGSLTGKKICNECGGKVLNLQEAFDHILEIRAELREDI